MSPERLTAIKYSALDLATSVVEGKRHRGITFKHSLALAKQAEDLGYTRYWFAEHHNMISVASSATAVLIGYIAGGTQSIRVGLGGSCPNHAPLIVAEQFQTFCLAIPWQDRPRVGQGPGYRPGNCYGYPRGKYTHFPSFFPQDVEQLQTLFSAANSNGKVRAKSGRRFGYQRFWRQRRPRTAADPRPDVGAAQARDQPRHVRGDVAEAADRQRALCRAARSMREKASA